MRNKLQCVCATIAITTVTAAGMVQAAEIDWSTIDCGGTASSTGGAYALAGTIGQPDAGPTMTGGSYAIVGGFWPGAAAGGAAGGLSDYDGDGDVDLGDFSNFSLCYGGANNPPAPTCPPGVDADFDNDGDVDLGDFSQFALCFGGAGNPPPPSCALF